MGQLILTAKLKGNNLLELLFVILFICIIYGIGFISGISYSISEYNTIKPIVTKINKTV